jgi:hypothetical protein
MKANYPLGYRKDATTVRVQDGQTITSDGTVGGIDATPGSFYVFEPKTRTQRSRSPSGSPPPALAAQSRSVRSGSTGSDGVRTPPWSGPFEDDGTEARVR